MVFTNPCQDETSPKDRKRKYSLACIALSVFLGAFSLLAGILVVVYFRGYVEGIVRSEIPIVEGSRIAESWKDPPVKPLLKIYFFNITNPVIFQNPKLNVKPVLKEVGPYVYEEKWERINVSWTEDGEEVNFGTKKTYFFRPDLSVGSEDDLMTLPNIPMISALRSMKYSGNLVKVAFQSMLEELGNTASKAAKNPNEGKRDIILPIFWSEESVGEIEDAETLALLHKGVHAPQQATVGL